MSYSRVVSFVLVIALIIGAIVYIDSHKVNRGETPSGPAVTVGSATSSAAAAKAALYPLASELADPTGFINTDGQPIKLGDYVGKDVVLVDFWTYSCINCIRTLPYLEAWAEKYKDHGLVVVGVHTPEFGFEKVYDNVAAAVRKFGLSYPIVLDSNYGTWNAYENRYWPSEYLVDVDGYVRSNDVGEGNYAAKEAEIQKLLAERDAELGITDVIPTGTVDPSAPAAPTSAESPETYFGSSRNDYLGNGARSQTGTQTFLLPQAPTPNTLYLGGTWDFEPEAAKTTAAGDTILYRYEAKSVYFVASADATTTISIIEDGEPAGAVSVKAAQLYPIVSHEVVGEHTVELKVEGAGLSAFTFTFG